MIQRLFQRLTCSGTGYLILEGEKSEIEVVNLSKNGACFKISINDWASYEEMTMIEGSAHVENMDFQFKGRVAWSAIEEERIRFGVEFQQTQRETLNKLIDKLTIQEAAPPEDLSFNL